MYALPACYGKSEPPTEKPSTVTFEFCADAGAQLEHLAWDSWSATGATGKGDYSLNTCDPNCAEGGKSHYPVIILASDPVPAVRESRCPPHMQFYSGLLLAFPTSAPHQGNIAPNSRYNSMPAMRFSTGAHQADAIQLITPGC